MTPPASPHHRDIADLADLRGRVAIVTGGAGHIGRVRLAILNLHLEVAGHLRRTAEIRS